jgi:hypothetical protein
VFTARYERKMYKCVRCISALRPSTNKTNKFHTDYFCITPNIFSYLFNHQRFSYISASVFTDGSVFKDNEALNIKLILYVQQHSYVTLIILLIIWVRLLLFGTCCLNGINVTQVETCKWFLDNFICLHLRSFKESINFKFMPRYWVTWDKVRRSVDPITNYT